MDGNRGYSDDTQPSWYTGQNRPASPYDSGVHERPSGAFRLPEQRATETAYQPPPYLTPASTVPPVSAPPVSPEATEAIHDQIRVPVRGPEYPAVRPTIGGTPPSDVAPEPGNGYTEQGYAEPQYPEPSQFPAERVYRTKRPVSALMIGAITGVMLIPALVLLFTVTFLNDVTGAGVIPAVLLTMGLLLAGLGLFALTQETPGSRADWLRPPVVHLPVGLILLITAAIAIA